MQTGVKEQASTMEAALKHKADYQEVRRQQRQQVAAEIERNKRLQASRSMATAKATAGGKSLASAKSLSGDKPLSRAASNVSDGGTDKVLISKKSLPPPMHRAGSGVKASAPSASTGSPLSSRAQLLRMRHMQNKRKLQVVLDNVVSRTWKLSGVTAFQSTLIIVCSQVSASKHLKAIFASSEASSWRQGKEDSGGA